MCRIFIMMELSENFRYSEHDVDLLKALLTKGKRFLFLGPKNMDGDTIGANTPFAMFLEEQLGKEVILYNPNPTEKMYVQLPWSDRYVTTFDPEGIDGIIVSDTGDERLFAGRPEEKILFERNVPLVNIDHHKSNTMYGGINLVDLTKASSSLIVFDLLEKLRARITPAMATLLLMGIYFDTGSMYHPNTTAEVYTAASKLMRLGAEIKPFVEPLYKTMDIGKLRLIGLLLDRATLREDGMLMSAARYQEILDCGATRDDLEGVIDYLNYVPEAQFAMLLTEDEKGNVKGSLRTQKDTVDVAKIAGEFGGGGHRAAAGFTLQGKKLEMRLEWKIAERV